MSDPNTDTAPTETVVAPTADGQPGTEAPVAAPAEPTAEEKAATAAKEAEAEESARKERSKNRTRDHINNQHRQIVELRAQLAEREARGQAQPAAQRPIGEPKPEDFNFDHAAYTDALVTFRLEQRLEQAQKAEEAKTAATREQEIINSYSDRVMEFTETVPDFEEVVSAIPAQFLARELQIAIMSHARGPEIAYHIATNDDDLFQLALIRPELLGAALERLVKRLAAPQSEPPERAPAPPAVKPPLTKAPPPPPTVRGHTPTDTPDEKLTDQQWADRQRERERKR